MADGYFSSIEQFLLFWTVVKNWIWNKNVSDLEEDLESDEADDAVELLFLTGVFFFD